MSNTFTGNYADGQALTKALLDTAYQTLQLDIANTALTTTGSTTGQAMISNGSGAAASFQTIPDPQGPFSLRNYGLQATAASGILTISLKSKAGTNPTSTDSVNFNYSTNGTISATYATVNVTQATSIAINSSATLGYTATSTARIFVYGYYNTAASIVKLAVSARSDLDNGAAFTTTLITATSDNLSTLYATAALTVVPRLLGWTESAHTAAGAWQTPTKTNLTNNNNSGLSGYGESSAISSVTSATSAATVASATVYTNNRPVRLYLVGSTTSFSTPGNVSVSGTANPNIARFAFKRGSTIINTQQFASPQNVQITHAPGILQYTDYTPGNGSITYNLDWLVNQTGSQIGLTSVKLVALCS